MFPELFSTILRKWEYLNSIRVVEGFFTFFMWWFILSLLKVPIVLPLTLQPFCSKSPVRKVPVQVSHVVSKHLKPVELTICHQNIQSLRNKNLEDMLFFQEEKADVLALTEN